MNKKIQIIRGLSIIAVIVIHTYNTYAWGGYGVIIRPLVNFAVGMFIFLSGYLTKENENGVYRDIIYRRIKKIIVPYIIWSFIFAIVNRRINTFIPDVFMSKCNGIYYFILVYIQMVLLIPVTFKLLRSRFSKLGWFVTPISIFLIRYISLWFNIELGFPFQGELFVFWFGFYYLGVSLKNGYINLQLSPKCLTNLCLFSLVIQGVEGFIWYWMGNFDMATTQLKMSSIITTGLFCISAYIYIEAGDLNLNEQPVVLKKFLKVLGDNSFGIYLCHMLIIRILNVIILIVIRGKGKNRMTYHQLMLENQQLLARKLLERVAEEGLSSGQPKVLEFLLEHDGCMQKEIAHACSVEAASVTSLLNKMERDGLVQRKIPQDNRRVSQVWLTEAGRQKAQMVRDTFTRLEERLFKGFTSRERQSLLDMLQRIQENLKEDGSRE